MLRLSAFLIAVLLVLILPIRLAGATALSCETESGPGPMNGGHRVELRQGTSALSRAIRVHSAMRTRHADGQCGTCVSCSTSACEAGPRFAPPGVKAFMFYTPRPMSDPESSFLTEGIDRPPRIPLA
jgi:hypothetical protein